MLLVRSLITVLCAIGFYASVFMLRKSLLAARGELTEPSVVQTERATLFFGVPNSAIGLVYYTGVAAVSWLTSGTTALVLVLAAVVFAAGTSAYLGYSLLFVTKRSCPYCWTAHAVNWMLLLSAPWLMALR